MAQKKQNYSTRDLVRDMNEYFIQPMSFGSKMLAAFLMICLVSFSLLLTVKAIKNIWTKKKK